MSSSESNIQVTIIGFAVCPVAGQVGHDADEARANLTKEGDVYCVTCHKVHPGTEENKRRAAQINAANASRQPRQSAESD